LRNANHERKGGKEVKCGISDVARVGNNSHLKETQQERKSKQIIWEEDGRLWLVQTSGKNSGRRKGERYTSRE